MSTLWLKRLLAVGLGARDRCRVVSVERLIRHAAAATSFTAAPATDRHVDVGGQASPPGPGQDADMPAQAAAGSDIGIRLCGFLRRRALQ